MRTNFQRRSDPKRRTLIRVFVALAVLLGSAYLVPTFATSLAALALSPFHAARTWFLASEHAIPSYLKDRTALVAERDALRAEVAAHGADDALRATLEAELARLQGLPVQEHDRIAALVLRTPPETPYDTLVIASGADAGIVPGALVYAARTAIGQVASVSSDTSVVVLFSTSGVEVPVYLWGADVFARAEGVGGGVIRIGIPQGLPLAEGDAVTIPVPGTAIFGRIDRVEADPTNPEQYAFVTHAGSLRSIRAVAVDRTAPPSFSHDDAVAAVEAVRTGAVPSPFSAVLTELPVATTSVATTTENQTP